MRHTAQLPLFSEPAPLLDGLQDEIGPTTTVQALPVEAAPPDAEPTKAGLRGRRRQFEDYLRSQGWPYVAVDEAKRAIFSGSAVGSFDFLVYATSGPNLLTFVLADRRAPTRQQREALDEWERTFGADFVGAFVTCRRGQWVAITLRDYGQSHRMEHARPLDLLL